MNVYRCPRCAQRFYGGDSGRYAKRCPLCRGRLFVEGSTTDRCARTRRLLPFEQPRLMRAVPGSYEETESTYPSLFEFARADPRRLWSHERDFGYYWRDEGSSTLYRAAWVQATGELYVVQSGQPERGGGHVEVLGTAPGRESVARALSGWEEACRRPGSLRWLRERAARGLRGLAPRRSRATARLRPKTA